MHTNPVGTENHSGGAVVFAKGGDQKLWQIFKEGPDGGWSAWGSMGGPLTTPSENSIETASRSYTMAIYFSPFSAWVENTFTNDDVVAGYGVHGNLEVFGRTLDGHLWHKWLSPSGQNWSPWNLVSKRTVLANDSGGGGTGIPLSGSGNPALTRLPDGRLVLFTVGASQNLWVSWQMPPAILPVVNVGVTSTGFLFSRVTQTFNGVITVTNRSQRAIVGPLQLVLNSLAAGVTLASATGTTNGSPYITVSAATLEPGASASVNVQFNDPSNVVITFTPTVYSGTF
jgi:hypothetical protein